MRSPLKALLALCVVVAACGAETTETGDSPDESIPTTVLVSRHSNGSQGVAGGFHASISADGRHVVFSSNSGDLIDNDRTFGVGIFVTDTQTGETKLVSRHSDGTHSNRPSFASGISADGQYVAYVSEASNLVDDDTNGEADIFVTNTETGETMRVNRHTDGTVANNFSGVPVISADGQYVAYVSEASNLVDDDTNETEDIFVTNTQTGETTLVTRHTDGTVANGYSSAPSILTDGQHVAYRSAASNLVDDDTNGETDIFVTNIETGETKLLGGYTDDKEANDLILGHVISGDGRFVAYHSTASNLVDDDTNEAEDIFVSNIETGETTLVARHTDGTLANGASFGQVISADGQYVAYQSDASNLVDDDTNEETDVFVTNIETGETTLVSRHADGTLANADHVRTDNTSLFPSISADGRSVAYHSRAPNLIDNDTNEETDVFISRNH